MHFSSRLRACAFLSIALAATAAFGQSGPSIVTQPASQTVNSGDNAIFSVSASGQTPLSYQWLNNGTNLTDSGHVVGATNSSVTIVSTAESDIGSYTVVISNRHGSVTSSAAILTVLVPVTITQQPQSPSVIVGNSTALSVGVDGTAPIGYQWYHEGAPLTDGTDITGVQSANLSISNASAADAGNYTVVVSNAFGTATSAVATVTVLFPPAIDPLVNPILGAGTNLQLTATIRGTLPLTNQWFFNGAPLETNGRVYVTESSSPSVSYSSIIVNDLQASDAGTYVLVSSNIAGSATSLSSLVTVGFPPTITTPPEAQTVVIGTNVTFTVTATGTTPGYQWTFNGVPIDGATNTSLTIADAQAFDQGQYQVLVANAFGSASASASLGVVTNPVTLLNLDLTSYSSYAQRAKAGPAAIGQTANDRWNIYTVDRGFNNGPGTNVVLAFPVLANGAPANAVFVVINGIGWATNGTADPMYNTYVYSTNESPVQVRVFNLPPGTYDFYVYGHEPSDSAYATYQLSLLGTNYTATNQGPGWNASTWREGSQYVVFHNIYVPYKSSAVDIFAPSNAVSRGVIAGLQVAQFSLGPVAPEVWTEPTGAPGKVAIGRTVNIPMTVTGTLPISYQWWKDGVALSDDGRISGSATTNLTVANVQTNDDGYYWLMASNAAGIASNSYPAQIDARLAPHLVQAPTDQTNLIGSIAVFSAVAEGDQPLTYEWDYVANGNMTKLVDNGRIIGAATSSLTISNVQTSDAGVYYFEARNAVGADAALINLVVPVPPVVTSQPIGLSIPLGLATMFYGTASTAYPPLTLQWRLNGTNIPGATNATYFISSVAASDIGTYNLVASNIAGITVSSNAVLTVGPVAPWGENGSRQGLPPPGLSNVVAVAASANSDYALRSDGSVVAWGKSAGVIPSLTNLVGFAMNSGDTGVGLRADGTAVGIFRSVPITWTNIIAVAAGPNYSYALRSDGTVVSSGPTLQGGVGNVTAISAGVGQVLGLRSDGTVVAWAESGALTNIPIPLTNVVNVCTGYGYALAATSDGRVLAWGTGSGTNVPVAATNAVAVAASQYSSSTPMTAALRSDGTIFVWGGLGHTYLANTNLIAPSSISNAVAVTIGFNNGVALVNDGSPQFIRPPVGGTAFSGNAFTLSAQVVGAPALAYQWSFNGTIIPDATNAFYTIGNIQAANAGSYQLTVTNSLGTLTSLPAPVSVMDRAPFFSVQPASYTAYVGSRLDLNVPVNGSKPMTYTWRSGNGGISRPDVTTGNNELILNPLNVTDAGTYNLVVSNAFGTATSATLSLTVRQVVAWGDNSSGKTNVPATLTNAIAVCGGDRNNMLALRADGTTASWGANGGLLGTASSVTEIASPGSTYGNAYYALRRDGSMVQISGTTVSAVPYVTNAVAIEADIGGFCYLEPDGRVIRSVTPLGTTNLTLTVAATNVVALSSFLDGFLAIHGDGTLSYTGTAAGPNLAAALNLQAIASSGYQGTMLNRDGTVQSWRYTNAPTGSNFVAVAADVTASAAVDVNGNVLTWAPSPDPSTNVPVGLTKVWSLDGGFNGFVALCSTNQFPPLPLGQSLDTANLVVSSRNSAQWYGQTNVTHDGSHAARSATLGSNTASSMRMLATNGTIRVSFWWKVSSATNHGILTFSIGGVPQAAISGEVDWQQVTFDVPAGPQMLVWTYAKDSVAAAGLDAAFVDQLTFTPIAPTITSQSPSRTILGGTPTFFTVNVTGTAPLTYSWFKGTNSTPLANLSAFVLSNPSRGASGTYYAVVANSVGSVTSSNAVLAVRVPQLIGTPMLQPDGTVTLNSSDDDFHTFSPTDDLSGFQAQYSSNLVDWLPLNAPLSISNGLIQLNDADSTHAPARFYRIIENW